MSGFSVDPLLDFTNRRRNVFTGALAAGALDLGASELLQPQEPCPPLGARRNRRLMPLPVDKEHFDANEPARDRRLPVCAIRPPELEWPQ